MSNKYDPEEVAEVTDKLLTVAVKGHKSTESSNAGRAVAISLADAIEQAKYGKFNYLIIFVSGMVLANVLLEIPSIGFTIPIMTCDLALSNENKGVLSAAGYVGIIASSHLWGFLADTKGRRAVIWPTLIVAFVVTVFSSFATSYWQMVTLRFINGFFVSGSSATIYAYLGEFHSDKTRSRAILGSAVVFAVGAMFVPFLAYTVLSSEWILPIPFLGIDYKPWRLFMITCGLTGFICGIVLYMLPESPKFLINQGREEETIEVIQKIARWNGVKEPLKIPGILSEKETSLPGIHSEEKSNVVAAFFTTMWRQTVPLFGKSYLRVTVIVCFIQFWLYVITNGLYMWFPYIINSIGEFMKDNPGEQKRICEIISEKQAFFKEEGTIECVAKFENSTYMYSLMMEICYVVAFFLLSVLINRFSKITLLFVILIGFPACGIAAIVITNPQIAAYLYVLYFLTGLAINVLGAATVDLYPTELRGMAICISLMAGRIGGVTGSTISGALLSTQCDVTFYVASGAMIMCAFVAFFIRRSPASQTPTKTKEVEIS